VDVSDPTDLKPLSEIPYPILNLKVADSLLFVSLFRDITDFRIEILSLADPAQPLLLGSTPDFALQLDVEGERAYLAASLRGLEVVDISVVLFDVLMNTK